MDARDVVRCILTGLVVFLAATAVKRCHSAIVSPTLHSHRQEVLRQKSCRDDVLAQRLYLGLASESPLFSAKERKIAEDGFAGLDYEFADILCRNPPLAARYLWQIDLIKMRLGYGALPEVTSK
jgi:hypothetical protein